MGFSSSSWSVTFSVREHRDDYATPPSSLALHSNQEWSEALEETHRIVGTSHMTP